MFWFFQALPATDKGRQYGDLVHYHAHTVLSWLPDPNEYQGSWSLSQKIHPVWRSWLHGFQTTLSCHQYRVEPPSYTDKRWLLYSRRDYSSVRLQQWDQNFDANRPRNPSHA